MPLPDFVQRYLDRRGVAGSWHLEGAPRKRFAGAVVIPSLAEGDSLLLTLHSLARNPAEWLARFLVVVVINHGEQADAATRQQNAVDLGRLADLAAELPLQLAWIDAATPGRELPARQAGVGFARKLGMDLALSTLDWRADPLLVCLDADTLVAANYLEALSRHFCHTVSGAAVLPYRHQPAADSVQQAAIDRYELFLRSYVYGLRLAGSPYAFDSVGSAMACRAAAYVRSGGMNSRRAGEDFYFLQKLAKTDGVDLLAGTTVYPAPRTSTRVPFGTGRSMTRLLDGDPQAVLFYPVDVFRVLGCWLQRVTGDPGQSAASLLSAAQGCSPTLAAYLEQLDWLSVWPKIQSNHAVPVQRCRAFHVWFDGFRTLRLIHLLCDQGAPRGEPGDLLPGYFAWAGCPCPQTLVGMLEKLRQDHGDSS